MGAKEVSQPVLNLYELALRQLMEKSGCGLNKALQQAMQEARQNDRSDQEGQIKKYQQAARALRKKSC